jgi:SAM-dependent methyltransferase
MVGLRRKHPISRVWGSDRGSPVDRYYIEEFVERHAGDVRGRVLEIGTDMYTRRFGGSKVQKSDVLHVAQRRPPVTIIADLTDGLDLESDVYDCIILTQTLNAIYDVRAAIRTVHRVLKPGGVVLTTIPGISKVSSYDMERWGYYWSFTTASARLLFETVFPAEQVDVASYGNVSAAVAFLHGLAWKELNRRTLADIDPDYQLVITVRAVKPL